MDLLRVVMHQIAQSIYPVNSDNSKKPGSTCAASRNTFISSCTTSSARKCHTRQRASIQNNFGICTTHSSDSDTTQFRRTSSTIWTATTHQWMSWRDNKRQVVVSRISDVRICCTSSWTSLKTQGRRYRRSEQIHWEEEKTTCEEQTSRNVTRMDSVQRIQRNCKRSYEAADTRSRVWRFTQF